MFYVCTEVSSGFSFYPIVAEAFLLFHVKHFLQKNSFSPSKAVEFSVKIPKYYLD